MAKTETKITKKKEVNRHEFFIIYIYFTLSYVAVFKHKKTLAFMLQLFSMIVRAEREQKQKTTDNS